jgi:hypothetical protein
MKRAKKIGGFCVKYVESVRNGRVWFTARIVDPYICGARSMTPDEALSSLAEKWEAAKAGYLKSNLAVPTPPRSRGNKRIIDTLRKLGRQPFPTSLI